MSRNRPSSPFSAFSPSSKRNGRAAINKTSFFDAFVSGIYLPHARLRKRSWQVDERIARQHLSPAFGDRELASIERRDVELWLRSLAVRGLAPATCNRILAVLKSICTLAGLQGLLPAGQSPCAGVLPFKIRTMRERFLTHEEARKLMRALEHSPRREASALRLLLLTGARKSEILRARWENVRLDQRQTAPHFPVQRSRRRHPFPAAETGLPVAVPRPCAGQAALGHLRFLEQAAQRSGTARRAHP